MTESVLRAGDRFPRQRIGFEPSGRYEHDAIYDLAKTYRLDLVDFAVSMTAITTGRGEGGRVIFTFPPGYIYGNACAKLTARVATADQAVITNAATTISVGIGTVAISGGDAIHTTATDDNWAGQQGLLLAAYQGSAVKFPSAAKAEYDGTATAIQLFLNAQVPAADIADAGTASVLLTGSVWWTWANQGGVP